MASTLDVPGSAHASRHASGGADPITPAAIGASPVGHTHADLGGGSGSTTVVNNYGAALVRPAAMVCGTPTNTIDYNTSGVITGRIGYRSPPVPVTDLVLRYDNWGLGNNGAGEVANGNDVTVKAALEYNDPAAGGLVTIPIWWRTGQRTLTLVAGGTAETLPLAVRLPASTVFWIRTCLTYTPGTYIGAAYATDDTVVALGTAYYGGYTAGDTTASTGPMANPVNAASMPGPSLVKATPAVGVTYPNAWLSQGDSICQGTGDTTGNSGYFRRACAAAGVPAMNLGRGNEQGEIPAMVLHHARRWRDLAAYTHVYEAQGVNDLGGSYTTAQIQAAKIAMWVEFKARGLKIWCHTITPITGASAAKETTRIAVNTWIRDGAPIKADGTPDTAGSTTSSTVRIGQTGHPVSGYFETADVAETARNSGTWKTGYSDDGTHPSVTGHTAIAQVLTSAILTAA